MLKPTLFVSALFIFQTCSTAPERVTSHDVTVENSAGGNPLKLELLGAGQAKVSQAPKAQPETIPAGSDALSLGAVLFDLECRKTWFSPD
jgi:hypothetical protein